MQPRRNQGLLSHSCMVSAPCMPEPPSGQVQHTLQTRTCRHIREHTSHDLKVYLQRELHFWTEHSRFHLRLWQDSPVVLEDCCLCLSVGHGIAATIATAICCIWRVILHTVTPLQWRRRALSMDRTGSPACIPVPVSVRESVIMQSSVLIVCNRSLLLKAGAADKILVEDGTLTCAQYMACAVVAFESSRSAVEPAQSVLLTLSRHLRCQQEGLLKCTSTKPKPGHVPV